MELNTLFNSGGGKVIDMATIVLNGTTPTTINLPSPVPFEKLGVFVSNSCNVGLTKSGDNVTAVTFTWVNQEAARLFYSFTDLRG